MAMVQARVPQELIDNVLREILVHIPLDEC
jgi:hypothetical protein